MNIIISSVGKDQYKQIEQRGELTVVRVLPSEPQDGLVRCYETTLDHIPTQTEIESIEQAARDKETLISDMLHRSEMLREIEGLKQQLADTDYKAIKYAEGWITAEDYAPTKAERQSIRNRINELQEEIING